MPELQALTRKEAIWLNCREKSCCMNTVVVMGRDIWRIARALDAPFETFLDVFRAPTPTRDSFLLAAGGPRLRLVLAKQPRDTVDQLPGACTFLMSTRDGARRCGLGALRPSFCRAYPSEILDGLLVMRPDATCTCRDWSLGDVEIHEERALVDDRRGVVEEYAAFVADWNASVESAPPGERFSLEDYEASLLRAYDALAAAGGAALG
jgi:hypothetical protein